MTGAGSPCTPPTGGLHAVDPFRGGGRGPDHAVVAVATFARCVGRRVRACLQALEDRPRQLCRPLRHLRRGLIRRG
eukprot:1833102-Pyramimonas_sp.AAC.1